MLCRSVRCRFTAYAHCVAKKGHGLRQLLPTEGLQKNFLYLARKISVARPGGAHDLRERYRGAATADVLDALPEKAYVLSDRVSPRLPQQVCLQSRHERRRGDLWGRPEVAAPAVPIAGCRLVRTSCALGHSR